MGKKNTALTQKQQAFCREYVVDYNATRAAARAGYTDPNKGRQLAANPRIAEQIRALTRQNARKLELQAADVMQQMAAIATASPADYVSVQDGQYTVNDTSQWTPAQKMAVKGIRCRDGVVEIELYNKLPVLEKLAKWLGMEGASQADGTVEVTFEGELEQWSR